MSQMPQMNAPTPDAPNRVGIAQEQYDAFVVAHLTELWTNYGALDEIWFDGGYHKTLTRQLHDLLAKLQPNAVVFGGESLYRLSNQWMPPGYHEVAHVAGERLSCPFQLLARPEAQLSCAGLDRAVIGPAHPACEEPVFARRFVEEMSSKRVSSNFPR